MIALGIKLLAALCGGLVGWGAWHHLNGGLSGSHTDKDRSAE
jgi:hypothetical protein